MASDTKKTKKRRAISKFRRGKSRKRYIRNNGTTPKTLELNKPNANEIAQAN